jgi:hypothetical protein
MGTRLFLLLRYRGILICHSRKNCNSFNFVGAVPVILVRKSFFLERKVLELMFNDSSEGGFSYNKTISYPL